MSHLIEIAGRVIDSRGLRERIGLFSFGLNIDPYKHFDSYDGIEACMQDPANFQSQISLDP